MTEIPFAPLSEEIEANLIIVLSSEEMSFET
jgi:hypothetical protein